MDLEKVIQEALDGKLRYLVDVCNTAGDREFLAARLAEEITVAEQAAGNQDGPKYTWTAQLSRKLCPDCNARIKSYIGYRDGRRWTSGLFCPSCGWGDQPMGDCLRGGD